MRHGQYLVFNKETNEREKTDAMYKYFTHGIAMVKVYLIDALQRICAPTWDYLKIFQMEMSHFSLPPKTKSTLSVYEEKNDTLRILCC